MVNEREPFWGPNAKPMLAQIVAGLAMLAFVKLFLWEWISPEAIAAYRCALGLGPC